MSDPDQPRDSPPPRENWRALLGLVLSSAVVASLCCLPSVVLVLFGLASVSTAAALSDQLYWGPARYVLYAVSVALMVAGLVVYFRRRGICTLAAAKRERNRIVNTTLLVLVGGVLAYLVWNYLILDLIGIAAGLPWKLPAWWPF
ncbi:MAG: hypothetical protein FD161_2616 [Limisphaerales bacterium]|nr:MAG: hypothetical protein FD161_2616 [Limisphaerales bacterium]KAG0508433.1 MAG: hypothetical protein E1N63_2367 [Limisphaerales bacterium]TXT47919.1 MAG: hypothetical protein FD140_3962 [Limisphaerales bacterium]